MKKRRNTGNLEGIKQTITATSLHSVQVTPGHEINFYEFEDNDIGVNEILNLDQHTPILKQIEQSPTSAVELFRLIKPKAEIPQSLVRADEQSAKVMPEQPEPDEDALPDASISKQSAESELLSSPVAAIACPNDGYWHSWECDAQWFTSSFCNSGSNRFCPTNVQGWAWSRKTGGQMNITGMAAGFDTVAQFVIQRQKCNFIGSNCSWKTVVDTTLQPRTYSHWYFSGVRKRYSRIDTLRGEPRIHFAMTCSPSSSPSPTPSPYTQYYLCVSSPVMPTVTYWVIASSWEEAEQILRNQLIATHPGAGNTFSISRGACRN